MQAPLQICSERREKDCTRLEQAARAALGSRLSRDVTDVEWQRIQARVQEFMNILRGWDRVARADAAQLDKAA